MRILSVGNPVSVFREILAKIKAKNVLASSTSNEERRQKSLEAQQRYEGQNGGEESFIQRIIAHNEQRQKAHTEWLLN